MILNKKTAVIIGGGPAGLTAAYEFLKHTDIVPVVFEQSNYWGGISRTVDYKGNKIDIGGHRFFSKSEVVMKWWTAILPIFSDNKNVKLSYQNKSSEIEIDAQTNENQNDILLVRNRKSRIYFQKKFFDYPISLSPTTIKKIGFWNTFLIGFSYLKSVVFPIKNEISLEDFFINRFGNRLYLTFFKDYTEKVWGISCAQISAEWGAQRIKGLSITKTIIHFLKSTFSEKDKNVSQKKTETSLIEYFLYPKFGPGQMWNCVAEKIQKGGGILSQNKKIQALNFEKNTIISIEVLDLQTNKIETVVADYFISTMPVSELIASLKTEVPQNVKSVASNLQYRDFVTVGMLCSTLNFEVPDNWIYIQEPSVKMGRLQIFNNWSPFLVKNPDTIWMGLEYFCTENDTLWNLSDDDFKNLAIQEMVAMGFVNEENVLDLVVIKVPKTYPAYFGSYAQFDVIRNFTDRIENLFLVGRNGMHKYNNQDHSMLTAMEAVRLIKNKNTDKTSIWNINTEQEYHEEK